MNETEIVSIKILKLKYIQKGEQMIQTFCKIGSPHNLGSPSLVCKN